MFSGHWKPHWLMASSRRTMWFVQSVTGHSRCTKTHVWKLTLAK